MLCDRTLILQVQHQVIDYCLNPETTIVCDRTLIPQLQPTLCDRTTIPKLQLCVIVPALIPQLQPTLCDRTTIPYNSVTTTLCDRITNPATVWSYLSLEPQLKHCVVVP